MRLLFLLLVLSVLSACKAGGPPYKNAPRGKAPAFSEIYRFSPTIPYYRKVLLGELVINPSSSRADRTYFQMRMVGRTNSGSIAVRSYEGRVRRLGEFLELRSKRCYVYGKRSYTERLTPIERWDCEHLVFRLKSVAGGSPARGQALETVSGKRTANSEWLGKLNLHPLSGNGKKPHYFSGQLLETLPDGRVIAWGYKATRLIKPGMELTVLDLQDKIAGTLVVENNPGDFLVTRWKGKTPPKKIAPGSKVIIIKGPKVKGMFDA